MSRGCSSPSPASRSQFRGSEPFCRRICKATVSLDLQQALHRSPLRGGGVRGADAMPHSPSPRPEPLPEGRWAHAARLLSPACVCCTIPAQNLLGAPPSAGRNPLSESKAGIPGSPPQGPLLPCKKSGDGTLGLTARRPWRSRTQGQIRAPMVKQLAWSKVLSALLSQCSSRLPGLGRPAGRRLPHPSPVTPASTPHTPPMHPPDPHTHLPPSQHSVKGSSSGLSHTPQTTPVHPGAPGQEGP